MINKSIYKTRYQTQDISMTMSKYRVYRLLNKNKVKHKSNQYHKQTQKNNNKYKSKIIKMTAKQIYKFNMKNIWNKNLKRNKKRMNKKKEKKRQS